MPNRLFYDFIFGGLIKIKPKNIEMRRNFIGIQAPCDDKIKLTFICMYLREIFVFITAIKQKACFFLIQFLCIFVYFSEIFCVVFCGRQEQL